MRERTVSNKKLGQGTRLARKGTDDCGGPSGRQVPVNQSMIHSWHHSYVELHAVVELSLQWINTRSVIVCQQYNKQHAAVTPKHITLDWT